MSRIIRAAAKRCIGKRFGKLYVKGVSWVKGKGTTLGKYVECLCDCGNTKVIRADSLERGDSTSCGCNYSQPVGEKFPVKQTSEHPMYGIFYSIQGRCKNPNNPDYKHYGGRGIKICSDWDTSISETAFINFLKDTESSYEIGLEIERIDVDKDYTLDNCTWVCRRSQTNNQRRSRVLSGFGINLTVSEWGYFLGFNGKMLDDRINKGKDSRKLENILSDTFRDRKHTLLYKGQEVNASQVWEAEGFTLGQRNGRINKYGDSLSALEAEGITVEVLKPREKDYMDFEEALLNLRNKSRDTFEDWLLIKIESQLKEEISE